MLKITYKDSGKMILEEKMLFIKIVMIGFLIATLAIFFYEQDYKVLIATAFILILIPFAFNSIKVFLDKSINKVVFSRKSLVSETKKEWNFSDIKNIRVKTTIKYQAEEGKSGLYYMHNIYLVENEGQEFLLSQVKTKKKASLFFHEMKGKKEKKLAEEMARFIGVEVDFVE
ncbi:MAG TPA: hypothetical protein VKP03_02490 [Patescibacteria group bacterium]|nr:hypothetical protein [Patescibacteria group bacterium]